MAVVHFSPVTAFGQFSVDGTIGLDQPTRDLISELPKETREEIIKTLQGALPLLDKSVDSYLAAVSDIVDHQIDHAQCAATGIIAEIDRRMKLPGTRTKLPLEIFSNDEKSQLARIKKSSNANFYARLYGDILFDATVTYCEMKISPAAQQARKDEDKYRPLAAAWDRIQDQCGDAVNCVMKLHAATQYIVAKSDPRDIQSVHASEAFAKVLVPDTPSLLQSFDPAPFNAAIVQMIAIQNEIMLASTARQARAASLMSLVQQQLNEVDTKISDAQTILKPRTAPICLIGVFQAQIDQAQPQIIAVKNFLDEIDSELSNSVIIDSANQAAAAKKIRDNDLSSRNKTYEALKSTKPYSNQTPGCTVHMN
jgi:hypothetical protein